MGCTPRPSDSNSMPTASSGCSMKRGREKPVRSLLMRCLRNWIPASYSEGKLFAPRIAKKLNGFAVETDYDATAEGGKVREGWNERPQLIGHNPGDSFDLPFKGSAVAIQVIAGPKAGIIEHSVDGSDWVEQDLFVEKNSFKLHLNRIYILREGLDPDSEHTLRRSNQ